MRDDTGRPEDEAIYLLVYRLDYFLLDFHLRLTVELPASLRE
jgi:hypothetical protein